MIKFRPYPGLTVFTLVSLAILLTLGTWQYNRLGWKTDLLARIDAAASSAPFERFDAINDARAAGDPIDFRRVNLRAHFVKDAAGNPNAYHVYKSKNGKTRWRLFREVKTALGQSVFVAGELVPNAMKSVPHDVAAGPVYISGYVRTWQKPSRFAAKSTPQANRWFSFNALKDTAPWTSFDAQSPEQDFYIDAAQVSEMPITQNLPVKKPDLPNNHFDYMLTWYSFALILLVIYVILHIRGGRLKRS